MNNSYISNDYSDYIANVNKLNVTLTAFFEKPNNSLRSDLGFERPDFGEAGSSWVFEECEGLINRLGE